MIYLDNAATTVPKPPSVVRAVADAMASHGNAARGAHRSALAALRTIAALRARVSEVFGVGDPARVVLVSGATMALNMAVAGLPPGRVVTTAAEHNSVLRPLHRRGDFDIIPVDALGRPDMSALRAAVAGGAAAVVMTHASNVCGNVHDIAEVGEMCRARRIPFVVDAAQTAGLLDIDMAGDMAGTGISALCFSGHKSLHGPQGIGCLCLAPDFFPPAVLTGGTGGDSFSFDPPADLPASLEAGTLNAHGAAGLLAGLEYGLSLGGDLFRRADALARRFVDGARAIPGVTLYGDMDAPLRLPIAALNIAGVDAAEAADILDGRHGIAVRAGVHCAPLLHRAFGTAGRGALRFSFSHGNTDGDVDLALSALRELSRSHGS